VRHLRLDRNYGDYGNTPRGVGALLAMSGGYEGIGLLDADNWLEKDHISACVEASLTIEHCDYVIAQRNLCRPDGSPIDTADHPVELHVDTNCFFLLPGSYHVMHHFSLMPAQVAPICDRVFYAALKGKNLNSQIVKRKTVNYHCLWAHTYEAAGEAPPPNAKRVDFWRIREWLAALDPRQLEILERRCGCSFVANPRYREGISF